MNDPDPTPAAWIIKAAAEICVNTFLDAAVNHGIDEETAMKYLDDKTIPENLILRNAAIIERNAEKLKRDMQCVRALLREVWQEHDLGGESMGRSYRNTVLELAMRLLDLNFEKDTELANAFDADYIKQRNRIGEEISKREQESTPCPK